MSPQPPEGGFADSSGAAGPAAAAIAPGAAAMPVGVVDGQATMTGTTATLPPPSQQQQQGQSRHKVAIVWFRRDLRVSDNPALMAAAAEADFVVRREGGSCFFFFAKFPSSFRFRLLACLARFFFS